MAKQIEMNYKVESGYEVIYPNVILNSVTDWADSIYSKSEIDDKVSEINQSISNAQMNPGGWENLGTFNNTTGIGLRYDSTYQTDTGVYFDKNYDYYLVINFNCLAIGNNSYRGGFEFWVYTDYKYYGIALAAGSIANNQQAILTNGIFCFRCGSVENNDVRGNYYADLQAFPVSGRGMSVMSSGYFPLETLVSITASSSIKIAMVLVSQYYDYNVTQNNITIYRTKVNNLT